MTLTSNVLSCASLLLNSVEESDYWDHLYSRTADSINTSGLQSALATMGRSSQPQTVSFMGFAPTHKTVFSKRSILDFQPVIQQKIDLMCEKFAPYKGDGQILNLVNAFSAFAGDIICQHSFVFCYNHLESPNFEDNFHAAFMAGGKFGHVALQFPWVTQVGQSFLTRNPIRKRILSDCL